MRGRAMISVRARYWNRSLWGRRDIVFSAFEQRENAVLLSFG